MPFNQSLATFTKGRCVVLSTFYENYLRLCELNGESTAAAAEACGLQRSTVTRWRDRDSTPNLATRVLIANHFNVPLETLTQEGAFDNGLPKTTAENNTAPIEWAQDEVEAGARAARRCQIIDRTADMSLAQLEQIIGILDLMFPGDKNGR